MGHWPKSGGVEGGEEAGGSGRESNAHWSSHDTAQEGQGRRLLLDRDAMQLLCRATYEEELLLPPSSLCGYSSPNDWTEYRPACAFPPSSLLPPLSARKKKRVLCLGPTSSTWVSCRDAGWRAAWL